MFESEDSGYILFEVPFTVIPQSAFEGCAGLKGITISEFVSTIEDRAFANCSFQQPLNIPENIDISVSAFEGCSGEAIIPARYVDSDSRTEY